MTDYLVPIYVIYLVTVAVLCTGLARTLYRNGAVFLDDVFADRPEMAGAVNRLLVTGFAMFNAGFGFFLMQSNDAATATRATEILARKLGVLLVCLALMHFANMAVLHWVAARRRERELTPPVAPQPWIRSPLAPPPPPQAPGQPQPQPQPYGPPVGPRPAGA